jgi:taurine dioxygenase
VEAHVVPKTDAEGIELVRRLTKHIIEAGSYAHVWQKGDLVLFDNRILIHAASPFDSETQERLLVRAEFQGEEVLQPSPDVALLE